ncbi:MAG: EF-hand domain-containing protein [Paraglaciecola sp.]|uniref:EF-hand domain-containing protein n=1 Tax=Paraglaciecola sp. TaxID=1920173 RepID=UPI0032979CFB
MKKLILASIVSFAAFNVLADPGAMAIHPLDTDKDGLVSVDEAKTDDTLSAIFSELDVNQDGYLSQMELEVKTENEID